MKKINKMNKEELGTFASKVTRIWDECLEIKDSKITPLPLQLKDKLYYDCLYYQVKNFKGKALDTIGKLLNLDRIKYLKIFWETDWYFRRRLKKEICKRKQEIPIFNCRCAAHLYDSAT